MREGVEDFETGGGGPKGIVALFQGGSTGGVDIQGRDVGPDPPDGAGPEQISAQGHTTAHCKSAEEAGGWGSWGYTLLAAAMAVSGFKDIGAYVTRM